MGLNFENGIVPSSSGADEFIYNDSYLTGSVIWVDSVNGNDANPGSYRDPLATLSQAITNATANNGDLIILKNGHTETLSGVITISKAGLKIFGMGTGTSRPKFTVDGAFDGISIEAANVELNNLYFPVGTTAANTSRINIAAANAVIKNCGFYCGQYDLETITIAAAGVYARIDSCTFEVSANGPDAAIEIESASAVGIRIVSCSFNGGTYNWDVAAINSGVAHTEFIYQAITLTNAAGILHSAAAKGWASNIIAGDTSNVQLES